MDTEYLNWIYQSMRDYIDQTSRHKHSLPCIYLKESFDMFDAKAVDSLVNVRKDYPNHSIIAIVCDESERHIYNKWERAIVLCGISLLDDVWIE